MHIFSPLRWPDNVSAVIIFSKSIYEGCHPVPGQETGT